MTTKRLQFLKSQQEYAVNYNGTAPSLHFTSELAPELFKELERFEEVKRALENMTPGGSEFHNEPATCIKHIKGTLESNDRTRKTLMQRIRNTGTWDAGVEAEAQKLREAMCEKHGHTWMTAIKQNHDGQGGELRMEICGLCHIPKPGGPPLEFIEIEVFGETAHGRTAMVGTNAEREILETLPPVYEHDDGGYENHPERKHPGGRDF